MVCFVLCESLFEFVCREKNRKQKILSNLDGGFINHNGAMQRPADHFVMSGKKPLEKLEK